MVQPEIIRRRLAHVDRSLEILGRLRRYSIEEFLAEPERYGSAERFLQIALEALLDLGAHVVAEENLGAIEVSRDIPQRMMEGGLIEPDLAAVWKEMVGFRNLLVHDYAELDRKKVWHVLQDELEDIAKLRAVFAGFL